MLTGPRCLKIQPRAGADGMIFCSGNRVIDPGKFRMMAGASSAGVRLAGGFEMLAK
jgi:hypothetical protein